MIEKHRLEACLLKKIFPLGLDRDTSPREAFLEYFGSRPNEPEEKIASVASSVFTDELPYQYMRRYGMLRASRSPAFMEFCRKVHGIGIPQYNLMDLGSLHLLIHLMKQKRGGAALDVGCGIGALTRYLSQRVNCEFLGIDENIALTRFASRRYEGKNLRFTCCDIKDASKLKERFDLILGIETLCEISDIERAVEAFRSISKPGSCWFFTVSAFVKKKEAENLTSDDTRLGRVLRKGGFEWEAIDASESERVFWKNVKFASRNVEADFRSERNLFLHWMIRHELKHIRDSVGHGQVVRRYLFVVRPTRRILINGTGIRAR